MAHDYTVSTDGRVVDSMTGALAYTGTPNQAIQWAIDTVDVSGSVRMGIGSFGISQTIKNNKNFVGSGKTNGTRLYALPGLTTDLVQMVNTSGAVLGSRGISDMELDGLGDLYSSAMYGGIQFIRCNGCVGDDLYIHDMPFSHGMEFQASTNNKFTGLKIGRIGKGGKYGHGISSGTMIPAIPSTGNEINKSEIYECSQAGVAWQAGGNNIIHRCHIHGNTLWSGGKSAGATVMDGAGYPISDGNQFIECFIEQDSGDGISSRTAGGVIVQGCDIRPGALGIGGTTVYVFGSLNGSIVEDNYLTPGDGSKGVYCYNSSNWIARRNHIFDTWGKKSCRGIWGTGDATANLDGATVEDNYIYDAQYGVLMAAPMHGSRVVDNICYDCATSVFIVNVAEFVVSGNKNLVGYLPMNLTMVVTPASTGVGGTVTVSGRLLTSTGAVPPAGMVITLVADNGDVIPNGATDASGNFSVSYHPSAVGTVYLTAYYGGSP